MSLMINKEILPWKIYLNTIIEVVLMFCLSTFSLGMYVVHGGTHFHFSLFFMLFLYVFVIGMSIKRMAERFSIAALMIIIPVAPLIVLMLIISLIPLLQFLK